MTRFYIFLVCVMLGVSGGILYDAFSPIRSVFRRQWVRIACDFLFCVVFGAYYLFCSVALGFPSLRFYNLLGCILGIVLYLKSFHKIVAFFAKKVYNRIKSLQGKYSAWMKTKKAGKTR